MGIPLSEATLRLIDGRDPGDDRPGAVRVVVRMVADKAAGYAA
jgi:hypothetical protein